MKAAVGKHRRDRGYTYRVRRHKVRRAHRFRDIPSEKEKLDETLYILLSTEMSGSQTINCLRTSTSRLHLKHPCSLTLTHAGKVSRQSSQERVY